MSERRKRFGIVPILTLIALAALVFFWGCSREPSAGHHEDHAGHEHAATTTPPAGETVAIEQTTCPVMEGNPINKNLFVEYKGKKVYFCCAGCPEKFLANPEAYVAKLPQFQD
jgi:YHS domain-containing protein